ncbi:hypothetical protein [Flavobacterium sp. 103]|uniref:hypothetical protein n=1 Tax=Flavobacterium sp. 103 TaxID=2135624 RepID=UPI001057671D|nr:hypothetical protein [Flavobacterium sp. 103]
MKKIILVVFLIFLSCEDLKYKSLDSEKTGIENLLKKIIPNKNYEYWEINYVYGFTPKVIFSKGKKELKKKYNFEENNGGFFTGCQPGYCNYNINFLENGKWHYIKEEKELARFINKIDNVEEAFLIARINEYDIDSNDKKGRSYTQTENGYKLKVMKYNSCPESKESFLVSIDSLGKLKQLENLGFYLKSKDCIVY